MCPQKERAGGFPGPLFYGQCQTTAAIILLQRIAANEKRLEKLEVRTRKNSHNSSKPPSSDPPFARQKRKQRKSKKPRGVKKATRPNKKQQRLKLV
jgi:hypothetical protein